MKFNKIGQAALEFLTTYGWAFLVILVMIGGLSYFGVFNFSDKLPDACKLDNKLTCGQIFVITDSPSDTLQFQVKNDALSKVTLSKVSLIEKSIEDNGGNVSDCIDSSVSTQISPGSTEDVSVSLDSTQLSNCGISDNVDSKKTFNVKLYYSLAGSSIKLVSRGTITTTVNAG